MNYAKLMYRCIELARKGEGKVSPNPLVGAVVLNRNGGVIAEGYHHQYGENHAERDALLKLNNNEAVGGTIVVNLEPCSHYGKTPPCADLIIAKGLKKVVIGMRDVNPIVCGNGILKLQNAGIEVIENVLKEECEKLNEVFIKNKTQQKTFVAIKSASTIDGKIATYNGSSKWITSQNARNEVLKIRNRYDAILTSSSTVIADNPTMAHKNKIILDRELKTDIKNADIYKEGNIFIFYDKNIPVGKVSALNVPDRVKLIPISAINNKLDIAEVLTKCFELGIMSVLVEAGGKLNGSMLKFADKIYQFIAPKILGDNKGRSGYDFRDAEDISIADEFIIDSIKSYPPDILLTLYKE